MDKGGVLKVFLERAFAKRPYITHSLKVIDYQIYKLCQSL